MSSTTYKRLHEEVEKRTNTAERNSMVEICELYEGKLPGRYDKFFPKNSPRHIVNLIRLGWDDLATQVGKLPDIRGETQNSTKKELEFVGLQERIGHSYLQNAEPTGKAFMWQLAWWLLAGAAVALAVPDSIGQRPKLTIRDPRDAYPQAKKTAAGQIVELRDIVFKYTLSRDEMLARGLQPGMAKDQYGRALVGTFADEGTVLEYIDDEKWIIASDGGTVQTVQHGLGMVPGYWFNMFAPNKQFVSQFEDQISFEVAISQMISMKLAAIERQVYPIMWVKGHQGNIDVGPHVINKLSAQGEMGTIAPPATLQVDRDIAQLERFSRILNRNPEVRQGEVQAKGQYVGAKTLESLSEAIDTVVGRYWDVIGAGLQYLLKVMYKMDELYWPDVEKSISGVRSGNRFRDKYSPATDIAGRDTVAVDYGFTFSGYQGFLQTVQANQAGLLPKRRAVEAMPGVSDANLIMREMEIEQMDDVGHALFMTLAQNGQLDPVLWAEVRRDMAKKGWSLNEAMEKYQDRLAARAEQAQAQGQANALESGAEPPPEGPPQEAALAGLPPTAVI